MRRHVVTVFGSSQAPGGGKLYHTAFALGRAIAENGWTLCNGGYGGTMEASAQGAVKAGGHTIGVTCAAFRRGGPNQYIKQEVPTFDLLQRLNTLIRLGRAYVVLPGGTGTLVELALAWELNNKKLIGGPKRPVIVLGDSWDPVIEVVRAAQPDATELHVVREIQEVIGILRESFEV